MCIVLHIKVLSKERSSGRSNSIEIAGGNDRSNYSLSFHNSCRKCVIRRRASIEYRLKGNFLKLPDQGDKE